MEPVHNINRNESKGKTDSLDKLSGARTEQKQEDLCITYDAYLTFKSFNLYSKASNNYKLILIQFSDQFLCAMSTTTDS